MIDDSVMTYQDFTRLPIDKRMAMRADQLEYQNGACALCPRVPDDPRMLVADHCHVSGKLRGLVCMACNSAMAAVDRGDDWLDAAVRYRELGAWRADAEQRIPASRPRLKASYKLIADEIREQIQSGSLAPGAQLPAKRVLAEQYAAGASAVDMALVVLRSAGLIEGRQGKGVYVL
jgi:Bacterial regulatory proteins, gntR family/Recombination endonuclease VII